MKGIRLSSTRLRAAKRTIVALLAAMACDAGVTPPAEVPTLAISLREVRFFAPAGSDTPDTATVVISNNGRGSLEGLQFSEVAYQGAESGWLETATVNDTTLLLRANAELLSTGTYAASFDALLSGASNSPRKVTVTFEVGRTQSIDVSSNTLVFGATESGSIPPPQVLSITNGGEGTLFELEVSSIVYPPNGPQDWLDSSLASTVAPATLTLTPTSVLQPGTYDATVTISSRVARPQDVTVDVTYEVVGAPQIFLSADQIDLVAVERSTTPITKLVSVAERHRRNIDFGASIVPNLGWLTVSLDTTVTPAIMTLTADPTGLVPTAHSDTVLVTSAEGGSDTVAVRLDVSQGPAVAVSPDTVRFTMARAGALPDGQVIRIENDSSGTLTGLSVPPPPETWLDVDPLSSTTAPANFTLRVDSTNFTPGTSTAQVLVTGDGTGPRTVTVVFTMTPGPALSLSSDHVDFYAVDGQAPPAGQSIEISNGGDGTLDGVTANSSEPWLNVTPVGPSAAPVELLLEPDAALTASLLPGNHTATVTVTSGVASNTPAIIDVLYRVAPEGVPSLALSPDSVRFTAVSNGPLPSDRVVEIENVGGSSLTVTSATDTAGWLSVSLEPAGNPRRLRLRANTAGYAPGVHTAQVTVTSDDPTGPRVVPAVLTVLPAPTIEFSTDLVTFRGIEGQGLRPDLAVAVTNGSNGVLTFVPPPTRPGWLESAILQGNTAPTELTLGFNTALATPPAGTGTISVGSSVASPAALAVQYEVDPFVAPLAAYSPGTVRFSSVLTEALPFERVIEIENVGGGTLTVSSAADTAGWLSVALEPAGNPTRIRLTADAAGYSPGTHTAEVVVTSNSSSSPDILPVEYTILAGPQIALSAELVAFFGVVDLWISVPQTVLISNSSNGSLQGLTATSSNPSWLLVDDGFLPDSVVLSVDTLLLSPNSYAGTVDVSGPGLSTVTVDVSFEWLGTAPSGPTAIQLSPADVRFTLTETEALGPQYVSIENVGGGTLTVTPPADPTSWLSVSLEGTTAPTRLRLDASNPNDTLGTYTTTISVVSNDPASPTTIPVSLTVLAGPELALSSDALTFYTDSGQALPVSQTIAIANGAGGTLSGITTSGNGSWLGVTPPGGTAPTEVSLQPLTTGLAPGTYIDTVLVDSPVAGNTPAEIVVTYEVGLPAVIGTSSDNINFTAARYDPVPTQHVLRIENLGGGTLDGLSVIIDPAASSWLQVGNPSSTTAPATVAVRITDTDLTPATLSTNLEISSPVSETGIVPVQFPVRAGPELAVSSDTVRFYRAYRQGALPAAQVVAVSNQSAGTLTDMTVSSSAFWLDATPADPGSAPAEITLQPNRTANGLVPGTDTATVSISSPVAGNTEEIVVVYYLDPGAAIALSNDAVDFVTTPTDPAPAPRVVMIENVGTGALEGLDVNPATVPAWLQASISPDTAPATLTLVADPAVLSPGTSETANLEITSPAADAVVLPVTFTALPGPSIAPTADSIMFRAVSGQALPDSQQLTVLNGSGGTLAGVYVDPSSIPSWLDATPIVPTAAPTTITLRPNTTALAAGDSVQTLRILSDVASNSPTVIVTYRVAPGPVLSASPADVVMTGVSGTSDTDVQTVLLENVSAGTVGGLTVGNTPSWLTATLDRTDAPAILTLTANPVALPVDTVNHTITVSSNDAANTADIVVTFVVAEPTTLSLSPQTVVFNSIAGETAVPDAQTVSIINAGSGQLRDIGVTANETWLSLSLDTSSVPATVTVQPNQVLESRSAPYTADIEVTSSTAVNSPRIAYVEYFVQTPAGPVIRLSPQTLTFERDNPPAQTVNITNGGSGTLRDLAVEVTYQGGNDWLFVLLDTRVAPAKLTVALVAQNAANAPPNSVANLRISGEGAEPQIVTVHLP